MISFTPTVQNILSQISIESFYLVKVGTYKSTNHFSNLTLSNGETYVADGKLASVDSPRLSATVDREIYKVSFVDNDYSLSYLVDSNLVGADFEVRISFIDPVTKLPVSDISDTLLAYKGIVDAGGYSLKLDSIGEVVLQISGASPVADLDATRTFYGSRDHVRSISPNDSSFDQVYEGSGAVNIKWGKG
jgi:hypothetical protein